MREHTTGGNTAECDPNNKTGRSKSEQDAHRTGD